MLNVLAREGEKTIHKQKEGGEGLPITADPVQPADSSRLLSRYADISTSG